MSMLNKNVVKSYNETKKQKTITPLVLKLYTDIDGTISDTYKDEGWFEKMLSDPDFFAKAVPFINMIIALKIIKERYGDRIEIFSLSAVNDTILKNDHIKSKNSWIDRYSDFIDEAHRIFCEQSIPKYEYIKEEERTILNVLLDDFSENLVLWKQSGMYGVKILNGSNGSGKKWTYDTISNQDPVFIIVEKLSAIIDKIFEEYMISIMAAEIEEV